MAVKQAGKHYFNNGVHHLTGNRVLRTQEGRSTYFNIRTQKRINILINIVLAKEGLKPSLSFLLLHKASSLSKKLFTDKYSKIYAYRIRTALDECIALSEERSTSVDYSNKMVKQYKMIRLLVVLVKWLRMVMLRILSRLRLFPVSRFIETSIFYYIKKITNVFYACVHAVKLVSTLVIPRYKSMEHSVSAIRKIISIYLLLNKEKSIPVGLFKDHYCTGKMSSKIIAGLCTERFVPVHKRRDYRSLNVFKHVHKFKNVLQQRVVRLVSKGSGRSLNNKVAAVQLGYLGLILDVYELMGYTLDIIHKCFAPLNKFIIIGNLVNIDRYMFITRLGQTSKLAALMPSMCLRSGIDGFQKGIFSRLFKGRHAYPPTYIDQYRLISALIVYISSATKRNSYAAAVFRFQFNILFHNLLYGNRSYASISQLVSMKGAFDICSIVGLQLPVFTLTSTPPNKFKVGGVIQHSHFYCSRGTRKFLPARSGELWLDRLHGLREHRYSGYIECLHFVSRKLGNKLLKVKISLSDVYKRFFVFNALLSSDFRLRCICSFLTREIHSLYFSIFNVSALKLFFYSFTSSLDSCLSFMSVNSLKQIVFSGLICKSCNALFHLLGYYVYFRAVGLLFNALFRSSDVCSIQISWDLESVFLVGFDIVVYYMRSVFKYMHLLTHVHSVYDAFLRLLLPLAIILFNSTNLRYFNYVFRLFKMFKLVSSYLLSIICSLQTLRHVLKLKIRKLWACYVRNGLCNYLIRKPYHSTHKRGVERAVSSFLVYVDRKTSVPHNGCRLRKLRRK